MDSPTYASLEARLSTESVIVLDRGWGTHLQTLGFAPTYEEARSEYGGITTAIASG